ncbi:MAG: peptidoglycan DD-metalloendopeptidase family protein [Lachnospira sp.]
MRNTKMVINKEKCILGGIMAVALLSVGIGLASVLSDTKSYKNNKENVIDLNEGIAGNTDDEKDGGDDGQESLVSLGNETGNAGSSGGSGNAGAAGGSGSSGSAGNSGSRNTGNELYGEDDSSGMTGSTGTAGEEGAGSEEMPVAAGVAIDPLEGYTFGENSVLMWPIAGNIVMNYSMDSTILHKTLGTYKTNPAINISAEIGTNVGAAASGIVQSIYDSEETGTTMVIAVGSGYVTTYGLLDNLTVEEGDSVTAGQVIGTVGAPTAYYVEEGPNVYFAVSKDGTPIDPTEYLAE